MLYTLAFVAVSSTVIFPSASVNTLTDVGGIAEYDSAGFVFSIV